MALVNFFTAGPALDPRSIDIAAQHWCYMAATPALMAKNN